ncbi:hypothetical protein GCM10010392_39670 [Streptomyces clavifer]|nr:hypothetical protein GCM10010392_39670 [Streptomyces clavifer]
MLAGVAGGPQRHVGLNGLYRNGSGGDFPAACSTVTVRRQADRERPSLDAENGRHGSLDAGVTGRPRTSAVGGDPTVKLYEQANHGADSGAGACDWRGTSVRPTVDG